MLLQFAQIGKESNKSCLQSVFKQILIEILMLFFLLHDRMYYQPRFEGYNNRVEQFEARAKQRFHEANQVLAEQLHGRVLVVWDKWGGFLRNVYAGPHPIPTARPDVVVCKIRPWMNHHNQKVFSFEDATGTTQPGPSYEEPLVRDLDTHLASLGKPIAIAGWTKRDIHADFIKKHGGSFLGVDQQVRKQIENKYHFNTFLNEVGIPKHRQLKHGIFEAASVLPGFQALRNAYGLPFVLQTDSSQGGRGTVIITDESQLQEARQHLAGKLRVSEYRDQQYSTAYLLTVPKPNGDCEVYVDIPSYKTTDIPELHINEVTGAGGDWTLPYPSSFDATNYVEHIVQLGKYLYHKFGLMGHWNVEGFMTDYGMDFNELNSRPGGGTEVSGTNQVLRHIPPFIISHIISWLGGHITYMPSSDEFNHQTIQEITKRSLPGPFYLKSFGGQSHQKLRADVPGNGVYRLTDDNNLVWVREGFATIDANFDNNEVLLAHVPKHTTTIKPKSQVCTIEGVSGFRHIFNGQHALSEIGLKVAQATNALFEEIEGSTLRRSLA